MSPNDWVLTISIFAFLVIVTSYILWHIREEMDYQDWKKND